MSARRRRLGVAGLALALLALVVPAFADTPLALTVNPSTGLSDGQVVTVSGTGFPSATVGTIRECGGTAAAPQCDPTTVAPFVTTAAGAIPPTSFAVKRIVNTGVTTFNCGVQPCTLVATAGTKTAQQQVSMAGAGTVASSSSTSTSSTATSSTTTSLSSTTSSTTASSTTTSSTASSTTTTVAPTSCAGLLRTQSDAEAQLDSLAAAYPQYRDVAAQARGATNARFAQALATAGC